MIELSLARMPKRIDADMREVVDKYSGAFFGAVYLLGTEIATKAMRYCPVDTGYLRRSRYVTKPTHSGYQYELAIGFCAPYAWFVHEINAKHVVGQWKFLAQAVQDWLPRVGSFLAATTTRLVAAGMTVDGVPEVHPTGPLIGPHIHPKMRRRRERKVAAAAKRAREGGTQRWE